MFIKLREQTKLRNSAILIGISLLLMAITAGFSYGYVLTSLIQIEQPLETLNNINASLSLFEMGLAGWILTLLLDILVSLALYVYFKPVHQKGYLLIAGSRLVYAITLSYAISHLFHIHQLILIIRSQSSTNLSDIATQVMQSAVSFETSFSIGLILFGVHLCLIGFISAKSKATPKAISLILFLAGTSYLLVHGLYQIAPSLNAFTVVLEKVLTIPMAVGELGFGIWLLLRGGKSAS